MTDYSAGIVETAREPLAHKGYARSALLAGFQVHRPKPVDPHDLIAVVGSLAGRTGPANTPDVK